MFCNEQNKWTALTRKSYHVGLLDVRIPPVFTIHSNNVLHTDEVNLERFNWYREFKEREPQQAVWLSKPQECLRGPFRLVVFTFH